MQRPMKKSLIRRLLKIKFNIKNRCLFINSPTIQIIA
jgi:hypothetical protein